MLSDFFNRYFFLNFHKQVCYKYLLDAPHQVPTTYGQTTKTVNLIHVLCFSVENIVEDIQQQQEDIAELDTKVDTTIDTVVAIGDKVIEHDKEIGELGEGLEKIEERVDDVEDDLGETKLKVEEVDNKVNGPA